MKKNTTLAALLAFCFTLSGCFGIEEKIVIHKDGSGVFSYTIDATEMMKQVIKFTESFGKAFKSDSTNTTEEAAKPRDMQKEAAEKLSKDFLFNEDGRMTAVKGISNFSEFVDTAGGKLVLGLSFGFTNVDALNNALTTMFEQKDGETKKSKDLPPAIYKFKDGILTRELPEERIKKMAGSGKGQKKLDKVLKDLEDSETAKEMLKGFKYVIIVEADGPIQSAQAPGAAIEKTGNRVVIDYDMMEKNKEIIKAKMKSTVKVY